MTVTYPLTPPSTIYRDLAMRLNRIVGVSQSPFTGEQQVTQHQGEWWEAEISLPRLSRTSAIAWQAFLARCRGRRGTFYLGDPNAADATPGTAYTTTASTYDGASDYGTRGANMTGVVDGKTGTYNIFYKPDAIGSDETLFCNSAGRFRIDMDSTGRIDIIGKNSGGTIILRLRTTEILSADTWHHIVASWDLANGVGQIYIDDTASTLGISTTTDDTLQYALTDWSVGALLNAFGNKVAGDLSEIWFDTVHYDLSDEETRRKFVRKGNFPADMGSDGSGPGAQPKLYAPDGDPSTNAGSGGDFTITGALTAASTSPSDGGAVDPKVDGASQTGNVLNIDGLQPGKANAFPAGSYIQIGTGSSARLYMVTADADADYNGEAALDIEPAIITAPSDNADIVYQSPVGVFRLTANDIGWSIDEAVTYGITFPARSVI